MAILSAAIVALVLCQEKPGEPPSAPLPTTLATPVQEEKQGVFDFGTPQGIAKVGFLAYSADFKADPQWLIGAGGRVDWPWMSREVLKSDRDMVGLWAEILVSRINRDIPVLDHRGTCVFGGFGFDVTAVEDPDFYLRGQLGLQIGYFGGVKTTSNGLAGLLGLDFGLKASPRLDLGFNPQVAFGNTGDQVYLIAFTATYRF